MMIKIVHRNRSTRIFEFVKMITQIMPRDMPNDTFTSIFK